MSHSEHVQISSRSLALPYNEQGSDTEPYLITGFILNSFDISDEKLLAMPGK